MQRSRSIRKIVQAPLAVERNTNVKRRPNSNKFIEPKLDNPLHRNIPKLANITNAAQPEPTTIEYSVVPKEFEGETIYIIGGGPSLKNFDFRSLAGSRTIAVNKAMFFYPNADVLYWTDSRFYTWYKNDIDNFKSLKFTIKAGSQYNTDVKILKKGKAHGLEKDPQILAHGFNSGYAAINLAYHLGAKRIILLGFDMSMSGLESHFHDGYPTVPAGNKVYQDKFLPGFKQLSAELKAAGIVVLNASPYSKLTAFPKITLEQALYFR